MGYIFGLLKCQKWSKFDYKLYLESQMSQQTGRRGKKDTTNLSITIKYSLLIGDLFS